MALELLFKEICDFFVYCFDFQAQFHTISFSGLNISKRSTVSMEVLPVYWWFHMQNWILATVVAYINDHIWR